MNAFDFAASRALWNRVRLDLGSDEQLAQLMDRGEMAAWRHLYGLMKGDVELRARAKALIGRVPLTLPHFWLSALASLGEPVDFDVPMPDYLRDAV